MLGKCEFDNPITGSLLEYDKAKQKSTEQRVGEWMDGGRGFPCHPL